MERLMLTVAFATVFCLMTLEASSISNPAQCNIFKFYSEAAIPCFTSWAFQQRQESSNGATTNLISFVDKMATLAGQSKSGINHQLTQVGFTMADPLSYLVDLAVTVEPYIVYMIADVIAGFELTSEDLEKLGLDASLANNKDALERFYLDYYEKGCERKPLTTPFQCMTNWLNECGKGNGCFVQTVLDRFPGFYCSADGSVLRQLRVELKNGLGHTIAPFLKYMGVKVNAFNPYVFSFEPSPSYITSALATYHECEADSTALTNLRQSPASYLNPARKTSLNDDIVEIWSVAGKGINCQLRSLVRQIPEVFSDKFICDAAISYARYGLKLDLDVKFCPSMDSASRRQLTEVPDNDRCEEYTVQSTPKSKPNSEKETAQYNVQSKPKSKPNSDIKNMFEGFVVYRDIPQTPVLMYGGAASSNTFSVALLSVLVILTKLF